MPEPNRSPTTFIPSINGPSIISRGLSNFFLNSSVSFSIKSLIPLIKEYLTLSSGFFFLHSFVILFLSILSAEYFFEISMSLSVALSERLNKTSSILFLKSFGICSYIVICPALTIAISNPALIA